MSCPQKRKKGKNEGVCVLGGVVTGSGLLNLPEYLSATIECNNGGLPLYLHLCDQKQQQAIRTHIPWYLQDEVLIAHHGSHSCG